ncbi:hypothetical protein ACHAWF_008467 [Thalassiosira exigua]
MSPSLTFCPPQHDPNHAPHACQENREEECCVPFLANFRSIIHKINIHDCS